jgi:hypothetical protein
VTVFTVILAVVVEGSTAGTTEDEFEASSAEEAEALAIAAWRGVRPDRDYQPLFTVARRSAARDGAHYGRIHQPDSPEWGRFRDGGIG